MVEQMRGMWWSWKKDEMRLEYAPNHAMSGRSGPMLDPVL